jgi:UDP:flavonoid glycosyltransferase YjiC (YdhE family)
VQPYVALGVGLKANGYDIRIGTHTNFESMARSRKLDFVPLSGNPEDILMTNWGEEWMSTGSNFIQFVRGLLRIIEPVAEQCALDCWNASQDSDAIIASRLGLAAGYHISEKLRIPLVPAYLQPYTPTHAFPTAFIYPEIRLGASLNRVTHIIAEAIFWSCFRSWTGTFRTEVLKLSPVKHRWLFWPEQRKNFPVLYGYSPTVVPKPVDWNDQIHVTGYWLMDETRDWRPPSDLADFLESGPAPIYVGFGSMRNADPEATTRLVVKALTVAKQRGVLLRGWGGLGGTSLPDHVFQVESVPHDWLFSRVKAVVHHGGAGTTAAGLRAGIPSIVIPFFADQPFWAHRIYKLGVGPKPISRKQLSALGLAEAITTAVTQNEMRTKARQIGQLIRAEDGVKRAVQVIDHSICKSSGDSHYAN